MEEELVHHLVRMVASYWVVSVGIFSLFTISRPIQIFEIDPDRLKCSGGQRMKIKVSSGIIFK